METIDLTNLLPLADGALIFTADTVPGTTLATQLSNLAGGSPITIREATRELKNNTLCVSGLVSMFGQPSLPVTLRAAVVPGPETLQLQAAIQLDKAEQPLQALWQRMGLPAPKEGYVPSDLAIHDLTLGADKTGSFWLEATLAPAPGWPLDLGPTQLQLANVKLTVHKPSGATAVSRFSGELALSNALTLAMDCDTAGSFSIGAQLPSTTPRQLVQAVTKQNLPALDLFDVALEKGSVVISREDAGLTFAATGTIGGIGVLLQARRATATTWGFALGLSLAADSPIGLPVLEQVRQLCRLNSMLLVVASFDSADFSLASLVAPGSPAAGKPLALAGGLQKGLTAYASWKLGGDGSQQLLRKLMPALPQELAVLLHLDATLTGGRMAAGAEFAFNKNSSNPLTFGGEFGCEIEAGKVGLFLSGAMQTQLQGQPLRFDVEAEFLPTGALVSGSMLGTVSFAPLPVSLSNVALVVGLDVEGVPSLGLAGTLAVQDFRSSVAVFFDSTNPAQSMLAGAISNLNLLKVLTTFVPKATVPAELTNVLKATELTGTTTVVLQDGANVLTNALKARQLGKLAEALRPQGIRLTSDVAQTLLVAGSGGNTWFLTDMSTAPPVHYELTKQGSALTVSVNPQLYAALQDTRLGSLTFAQGLFINAKLKILAFEALVNIKASLDKGLLVEGNMSRIVVGTELLFSITAESDPSQGPRVSIATYREVSTPTRKQMNDAAAQLQAWQQAQAQAQAQIMAWQQAQLAWAAAAAKQAATRAMPFGKGNASAPLPPAPTPPVLPDLGPRPAQPVSTVVEPHFTLDGKVSILGLQTGLYASVSEQGVAFQVEGTPQRGINIKLHGSFSGPTDLAVGGTLLVGLDGVTIDLKTLGKITLDTNVQGDLTLAVRTVPAPGRIRAQAATSVVNSSATFQGKVEALGQTVSLPTLALDVNSPSLLTIQKQVVDLLAPAFTRLLADSKAWLGYVAKGLITGVQDTSQALTKYYNLNRDQVLALYQQTGATAEQVGTALKNTFGVVAPEEAAKVLRAASYSADQAAQSLSAAYGLTKSGVGDMLDKAGYTLGQIGGTLSRVFGVVDPAEAGQLLGNIGRQFVTIPALGNARIPGAPRATAEQLVQGLSATYALSKDTVAGILQPVGYSAEAIGGVLRTTYQVADPNEVARLLKSFPADQVKGTLQSVYKTGDDAIKKALKGAGFDEGTIQGMFSSASNGIQTAANQGISKGKDLLNKIPGVHL